MTADQIIDRVNHILREHLGVDPSQITREADFMNDLGCDSLDLVELTMAFEEEFSITIPDNAADTADSVGKMYDYLIGRLA